VPRSARVADLVDAYDGFLLDAYGVLKDGAGALPGARELLATLRAAGKPYVVVTNDASRLPETVSRGLAAIGLDVPAADVVTSGSLLAPYFAAQRLVGARCLVLGTDDSRAYVAEAGGSIAALDGATDIDAVIVCDDDGYDFRSGLDAALSAAVRALDAGRDVSLVLPNPDLVYPKGNGQLGFTAGSVALLIETALRRRYPDRDLAFDALGKPRPAMFEEGVRRLGVARPLMVGDQLETDIAGAIAAGIDAVLVEGVSRWSPHATSAIRPTWLLANLVT
jgi:HAD superfamily hydrolase (TIGR01459 family)